MDVTTTLSGEGGVGARVKKVKRGSTKNKKNKKRKKKKEKKAGSFLSLCYYTLNLLRGNGAGENGRQLLRWAS